jgi:hypothetical protein
VNPRDILDALKRMTPDERDEFSRLVMGLEIPSERTPTVIRTTSSAAVKDSPDAIRDNAGK